MFGMTKKQSVTGPFTTFRMTRTRNAWNDEDAVLYSAENDEVANKKRRLNIR
jgi:hypothetical protein